MIQLLDIGIVTPQEIRQLANNPAVAKNLRDTFPYPYTLEDAVLFLELTAKGTLGNVYGIYCDDVFVGVGSFIPQKNEHRINAEIGYWIGEPYWGRGYATEAVRLLIAYAFREAELRRLYAYVYGYNIASMRVLEKVGFEKEAIIKSSVIKHGKVHDEHVYSLRKI